MFFCHCPMLTNNTEQLPSATIEFSLIDDQMTLSMPIYMRKNTHIYTFSFWNIYDVCFLDRTYVSVIGTKKMLCNI